jgi:TonB family protein
MSPPGSVSTSLRVEPRRSSVVTFASALAAMLIALTAAAQSPDDSVSWLRNGRDAYRAGRYSEAAEALRLATFGLLDRPVLLSEALARLAVADEAAQREEDIEPTLSRFLEAERRFAPYASANLEPEVRRRFEELLRSRIPAATLASIPGLAGPLGLAPPLSQAPAAPVASTASIAALPSPSPRPPAPTPTPFVPTVTPTAVPTARPTRTPTPSPTPPPPTATRTPTSPPPTPSRTPTTAPPTPTRSPSPPPATPTRAPTRTRTPPPASSAASTPPPPGLHPGALRPVVVPRESVDRPPVAIEMAPPVYPVEALRARIRGIVTLDVLVSETGAPLEVRVIRRARGGLTESAVDAVRRWRFRPATRHGVAVATWTEIEVPFEAIPYAAVTPTAVPTVARPTPPPARALRPPEGAGVASIAMEIPAPWPPEPIPTVAAGEPSSVYRTRRAVRLAIAPDQARILVDGRYVGIASDWDDRSGGSALDLPHGPHRLRAELPGYEPLDLEIDVIPGAEQDLVAVIDHLTQRTRGTFTRLPPVAIHTRGALELDVDPPDASVSVNGRDLGPASAFTDGNPLRLAGPAAHELTFSAPGRPSRQVRVLVTRTAPPDPVRLEVRLR